MENGMVEILFENNYGMTSVKAINFIEDYFAKKLVEFKIENIYHVKSGYWELTYSDNIGKNIIIGSARGYLEYSLIINEKEIDLMQYDERLKHISASSEKNISFVLDIIKRFLSEWAELIIMETNIFEIVQYQLSIFFERCKLGYIFKDNEIDLSKSQYKIYQQVWYNKRYCIDFIFNLFYSKSENNTYIFILLNNNMTQETLLECKYSLREFIGDTIEHKMILFFEWFQQNENQKLITILKGQDWVDTETKWWNRYK